MLILFLTAVSIVNQPEVISPLLLGEHKAVDLEQDLEQPQSPRKRPSVKGPGSKRLSGRPPITSSPPLKPSSYPFLNSEITDEEETSHEHRSSNRHLKHLIDQVSEWIKEERIKRTGKRAKHPPTDGSVESTNRVAVDDHADRAGRRRGSDVSETSVDLNKLEVS